MTQDVASKNKDSKTEEHKRLNSTLPWFVIQTKPQQERIARENLERQGFERYLPMIKRKKPTGKNIRVIEEPMFPRYLFIALDIHNFESRS